MSQYNDAKLEWFREATGIIGSVSINDLELHYFEGVTLETGNLNDLKFIYYENLGFHGNLNDMEVDFLEFNGINEGTINDRWVEFYINSPPPVAP